MFYNSKAFCQVFCWLTGILSFYSRKSFKQASVGFFFHPKMRQLLVNYKSLSIITDMIMDTMTRQLKRGAWTCCVPRYMTSCFINPYTTLIGLMMGIILHPFKPQKYSFLQSISSVEMYRSGYNQKLLNTILIVLRLTVYKITLWHFYKSNEKINVDCRFWDCFKNLDCVKVLRENAFLWIHFAANTTATSNHGKWHSGINHLMRSCMNIKTNGIWETFNILKILSKTNLI